MKVVVRVVVRIVVKGGCEGGSEGGSGDCSEGGSGGNYLICYEHRIRKPPKSAEHKLL